MLRPNCYAIMKEPQKLPIFRKIPPLRNGRAARGRAAGRRRAAPRGTRLSEKRAAVTQRRNFPEEKGVQNLKRSIGVTISATRPVAINDMPVGASLMITRDPGAVLEQSDRLAS